jgi:hypothetical protein
VAHLFQYHRLVVPTLSQFLHLWPYSPVTQAEFRFKSTAAHPAGFHSCYLTSPSMGKVNYEDGYEPEPRVDSAISAYVEHHHGSKNLGEQIALDAVVEMAVTGREPEAAVASAAIATQPDRISAGMTMFLDALMGATAAAASRARRRTKPNASYLA